MKSSLAVGYAIRHWLKEPPLVAWRARELGTRERQPLAQFEPLQAALLKQTLRAAAQRLPAYAGLRRRVEREDPFELLRSLPVIDKDALLSQRERYYPRGGRARRWESVGMTSGTSGTPLDVIRSYDSTLWEQACMRQHWQWAAWRPGETQVVLRGDNIVPIERQEPPFWFHDRIGRQLFVSTRHLTRAHAADIVQAINQHAPAQLRAYPSAAYKLAELMHETGLQIKLRTVITSSELLLPVQREVIESSFGARVFDHYGMAERVAFGMQCELGRLHVNPEYSLVEVLDERGQATDGPGFIVGTTLRNLAMPLLRYRLTDMACWSAEPCPCGRSYPTLQSLQGRIDDQLYDRDTEPVSAAVITFAFKGVPHIAKAQVAQVGPQNWEVRVVPSPGFGEAQRRLLSDNFVRLVSDRVNLAVRLVEDIPLLPSGKFKWVTQEYFVEGLRPTRKVA
jgi:phenylacetate-CoA ligase